MEGLLAILVVSYFVSSGSAHYFHSTSVPEAITVAIRGVSPYDKAVCDQMFGSANVQRVTSFKMNGGSVDFGDDPHLVGAPQGNAVICWSIDGRAAVKGKLYSDNFRDPQVATVEIRFRRTNGQVSVTSRFDVATQGGWVGSKEVEKVSVLGNFNQVRIRLKMFIPDTGFPGGFGTTVKTTTFTR